MAIQLPNSFTSYDLTLEEELVGSILSFPQKCVIQNLRCAYAEQKLKLKYDPLNPQEFIQCEAELQGQLNLLELLLTQSDEAVQQLNTTERGN